MIDPEELARFDAVDRWVRERIARHGDVYGWGPVQVGEQPIAVILVDDQVDSITFPTEIDGVKIGVRFVPKPEMQGSDDVVT